MEDFTAELSKAERQDCQHELDAFVVSHAVHHRPIAVVSSGGTVADLEQNSVRCLDNFSTGLRGAISVEELLKRGYAVIHLWRTGSAAPFARQLSQYLGLQQANFALDVASLGRLFMVQGEDQEQDWVQNVLDQEKQDPWLSHEPSPNTTPPFPDQQQPTAASSSSDPLSLHRSLTYSSTMQRALRERSAALSEHRLLTIPFRSVEEYLAKLQLTATAVADCQSLAMFFLAAAVSDFYIPRHKRAEHKIQSSSTGTGNLVLELEPVPKTIGLLRTHWAPRAFCVSFKLETDAALLRQKANRAVATYGVHAVVGNLLHSRHSNVWLLAPEQQTELHPTSAEDWPFTQLTKSSSSSQDSLESSIVEFVVQKHFEFISFHFHRCSSGSGEDNNFGMQAAERAQRLLREKKQRVEQEQFWKRAKSVGWEIAGGVLAVAISYIVNTVLRKRLQG